jgi:hypothetical protein
VVPTAWPKADNIPSRFRITDRPFNEFILNFYMTDPISRASQTMAECMRELMNPLHLQRVA